MHHIWHWICPISKSEQSERQWHVVNKILSFDTKRYPVIHCQRDKQEWTFPNKVVIFASFKTYGHEQRTLALLNVNNYQPQMEKVVWKSQSNLWESLKSDYKGQTNCSAVTNLEPPDSHIIYSLWFCQFQVCQKVSSQFKVSIIWTNIWPPFEFELLGGDCTFISTWTSWAVQVCQEAR